MRRASDRRAAGRAGSRLDPHASGRRRSASVSARCFVFALGLVSAVCFVSSCRMLRLSDCCQKAESKTGKRRPNQPAADSSGVVLSDRVRAPLNLLLFCWSVCGHRTALGWPIKYRPRPVSLPARTQLRRSFDFSTRTAARCSLGERSRRIPADGRRGTAPIKPRAQRSSAPIIGRSFVLCRANTTFVGVGQLGGRLGSASALSRSSADISDLHFDYCDGRLRLRPLISWRNSFLALFVLDQFARGEKTFAQERADRQTAIN